LALRESEDRFRGFFESAAIGMLIMDLEGGFSQVNRALCEMVGYDEEELISMTINDITHSEDIDFVNHCFNQLLRGEINSFQIEKRYIHKKGYEVWVSQNATLVLDSDNKPDHIIGQIQDITTRKEAEKHLQHMATHDPLTNLPNRSLFYDRLNHALNLAKRQNKGVVVLFLDLDGFKDVNDTFGHEKGDTLLRMVADRLKSSLRESDSVARMGGDEFAFVFENINGRDDAEATALRVLESLSKPYQLNGDTYSITGSIGISLSPRDGEDAETLVKNSDKAMYRAKDLAKNSFQFYSG
jgi:diguanylate cyclase (GGDEF)-like protein/PAS domain S-box-containing protein